MQPFTGKLINGSESFIWLTHALSTLNGDASLCSAFLKVEAFHKLTEFIPRDARVRILARWRAGDLLSGASDPECYAFAKQRGWDFHIKQDFHGKLYSVDSFGILVGSWNATSSGFGLKPGSNDEIGTLVDQDPYNKSVVDGFFRSSVLMTDSLYSQIEQFLQSTPTSNTKSEFPDDLQHQLTSTIYDEAGFLLSECFHSTPTEFFNNPASNRVAVNNDMALLGLNPPATCDDIFVRSFLSTKICQWTLKTLALNDGSISFGGLSAALHEALLEDPKPYRSDVKNLVKNLYSWIKFIGAEKLQLKITQPRHSEILSKI